MKFLLVLTCGILTLAFTTDALKCVKCINCVDSWPSPKECPKGSTCLKFVATEDGMGNSGQEVVKRKCADEQQTRAGCSEDEGINSCQYTCNTDGCNRAIGSYSPHVTWIIIISSIFALVFNN